MSSENHMSGAEIEVDNCVHEHMCLVTGFRPFKTSRHRGTFPVDVRMPSHKSEGSCLRVWGVCGPLFSHPKPLSDVPYPWRVQAALQSEGLQVESVSLDSTAAVDPSFASKACLLKGSGFCTGAA